MIAPTFPHAIANYASCIYDIHHIHSVFICINACAHHYDQTLPSNETSALCAAFQDVAFGHVEDRIRRALDVIDNMQRGGQLTEPIKGLVVVGGVAANKELRR